MGARHRVADPYGPLPKLYFPPENILPPANDVPSRDEVSRFSKKIVYKASNSLRVPVIYGPTRVNGIVIWEKPLSNGNWLSCYLIGWGPINSISNIKTSNEPIFTFGVTSYIYLGNTTTNATANTRLTANDVGWTSRLPGLAYVVLEFPNPQSYSNSKEPDPHDVSFDVEGLLTPDHRLDATLTTLFYSTNVAVCRADYWTNTRYGGARPTSTVDYASVDAAANICDQDLGGGKKRFRFGLRLGPEKSTWEENDRLMRVHAQMWDSFSAGKWQMFVDVDQTASSVVFIDSGVGANILDATMRDKEPEEIPNHVEFSYTDIANEYKAGTASTENPGIALRTISQLVTANYDTRGCLDFDQAKRLSIWAYNRAQLDKEYFFDILYDGGVKCVPGLVVTVTSDDVTVTNQLMLVTNIEDIDDLSFRVTCEIFSHSIYTNVIQTTIGLAPPVGPSPYTALPAPTGVSATSTVEEVQPGIFLPKVAVSFTPFTGVSAGGTLITVQVGAGAILSYGPFLSSPVGLVVPEGINQTLTIKAYSVDRNTQQAGTAFNSTTITTYNPNAPESISNITYDGAGGLYWTKPPTRGYPTFASGLWTVVGATSSDTTKINNGNLGDMAIQYPASVAGYDPITATGGAYVQFNTNGNAIKEIQITWLDSLSSNNEVGFRPLWYNGTTWIEPTGWSKTSLSSSKTIYYLGDTSPTAAFIMLAPYTFTPSAPVARIAEIQPVTYTGLYAYTAGYRLTGFDLYGALWSKDIFYTPDTTNPVKRSEWAAITKNYFPEYNAFLQTGSSTQLTVQTISSSNVISTQSVTYTTSASFFPTGTPVAIQLGPNSTLTSSPAAADNTTKIATTEWMYSNVLSTINALGEFGIGGGTVSGSRLTLYASGASNTELRLSASVSKASILRFGFGSANHWSISETVDASGNFGSLTFRSAVIAKSPLVFDTSGKVAIGDGSTPIAQYLSGTGTWNPGGVPNGAVSGVAVTVTGAAAGDCVLIGFTPTLALTTGWIIWGQVSGANTVTVLFQNISGGLLTPASTTVRASVIKH
jgi:hypothetical protein